MQNVSDLVRLPQRATLERIALESVDFGMMSIVFLAPLFLGGRHPVGRLVFVTLVCITAVSCACHQWIVNARWRSTGAEWLIIAASIVLFAQLAPLSPQLLHRLSPGTAELLPVWSEAADPDVRLGVWTKLSLAPTATRGSLAVFLAYALLFTTVAIRIRRIDDVERLFRWLAIAAVGMAGFGVLQLLFSNGKYFWFYEHPFRDTFRSVKGAFANENHFAHFLALGLGPLIWCLQWYGNDDSQPATRRSFGKTSLTPREKTLLAIGMAIAAVVFAGMLTFSRGGVIAILIVLVACASLYAWRGQLPKRIMHALLVVCGLVCASLFVFGYEPLMGELQTIAGGELDQLDRNASRRRLWAADLQAAADFPLLGTGAGSHSEVYPVYFAEPTDVEFTHAESGYVQVVQEAGIVGVVLLLCGIGCCAYWCGRCLFNAPRRIANCGVVLCAALLVSIVHSIWDFVWYIPACMSLMIVLLACACRLHQIRYAGEHEEEDDEEAEESDAPWLPHGVAWGGGTVALVALSTVMILQLSGPAFASTHWESYLRTTVDVRTQEDPSEAVPVYSMIQDLRRALESDPYNARAHGRLANLLIQHFNERQQTADNAVMLDQIRDAVVTSGFRSREEMDAWLNVAVGENLSILKLAKRHARAALQLSPLQGNSYVDLANLAFLDGPVEQVDEAFMKQALAVREHSVSVRFFAGHHALQQGDLKRAIALWRRPFELDQEKRGKIVVLLSSSLSASQFVEEFSPDTDGLRVLFHQLRRVRKDEDAGEIGRLYALSLTKMAGDAPDEKAAPIWHRAYKVLALSNQPVAALGCLQRAVATEPENYAYRRELAIQSLSLGHAEVANEQIRWCLRRKPDDQVLRKVLAMSRSQQNGSARTAERKPRRRNMPTTRQ